jgi:hypothetical protein
MRIARVVEKGSSNDSFPPLKDALPGVMGSASKGEGHKGTSGLLDEEMASNDEDEPDDLRWDGIYSLLSGPTLTVATFSCISGGKSG